MALTIKPRERSMMSQTEMHDGKVFVNTETTSTQDAIKAALLDKLDGTAGALDNLFAVMSDLKEKINPAPARPADTVDPNAFFFRLQLHEPMEAVFKTAEEAGKAMQHMRFMAKRVIPSPYARNAKAWGELLKIFSDNLAFAERSFHEAANSACMAAKLLCYAVTFAEADALPDSPEHN